jgi:uncharacterized protein (TIGR03437 family)
VFRTVNGGLFWDDITANLSARAVNGVAFDLESGTIYAATSEGLFETESDLRAAAPPSPWRAVPTPAGALLDVAIDEPGHQIYVLGAGSGAFAALAPHRLRDPRVVGALDHAARAAAPGSLLSVLGAPVASVRAGGLDFPILTASDFETQFQVPFSATGASLALALTDARAGRRLAEVQVPLRPASPSIFLDQDGAPMVLDADRGVLVEPGSAVRAGSRIQVLATGLGRVAPEWPSGVPAPAANTPRVVAPVSAYIDRVPVRVARANLAPGYVGLYLVEIEIPDVVNVGPAELYIDAGGQQSGRVSLNLSQR